MTLVQMKGIRYRYLMATIALMLMMLLIITMIWNVTQVIARRLRGEGDT